MPPRVLCDEMLGRLARWLRLLGVDAAYVQGVTDDALLAEALRDARLLLTRDVALAARARDAALLVKALEPEAQVREVAAALGLAFDPALQMTRCSLCNGALVAASAEEARPHVPPAVAAAHAAYWRCPGCGKHYWRGTHAARIEATLRGLVERGP